MTSDEWDQRYAVRELVWAAGLDKARRLASERGVTVEWVLADLRDYEPVPGGYDLVITTYLHPQPAGRAAVLHRPVDTEDGVRQAIDTLVLAVRPGGDLAGPEAWER